MKWCKKCVLPSTRPHLIINEEGICSACLQQEMPVDWEARGVEWKALVKETKSKRKIYDCLLPVSGGKDSFWQTKTCLDAGLHPLAFTWRPPCRTEKGDQNLVALRELGVDHVDFSVNPRVERIITRRSFEETGADSAMHLAVFTSVIRFAYQLDIPLVVWSENSATTYAGVGNPLQGSELTIEWVKTLGSTHGRMAEDWEGQGITLKDLSSYWCPTQEQLDEKGIRQVFLGYYLGWDGFENYNVARRLGFKPGYPVQGYPIVGYYRFADLDDPFVAAHHAIKMWKFGFNRTMDNLSQEIRSGRISREDAVTIIRSKGFDAGWEYIDALCRYVGRGGGWFSEVAAKFRNREIWQWNKGIGWHIPDFIVPDYDWKEYQ